MADLVYLSYPTSAPIPRWVNSLCEVEQETGEVSPSRFYLSGGKFTPLFLSSLAACPKTPSPTILEKLRISGYASRLIDAISNSTTEELEELVGSSPQSSEFRVLQDLWVLSRSSLLLVDLDESGTGRRGLELSNACGSIPTIGVSDSCLVDPWCHYYVDSLVKSNLVGFELEKRGILPSRA